MSNNECDKPNSGCVHLMVHFNGEVSILTLNVDPYRYFYFDLVDDINGLSTNVGYRDAGLSIAFLFFILVVSQEIPLKSIQMFLICLC